MSDDQWLRDASQLVQIRHEALRLMPYRDTKGKLTIGIGRNLSDRGISKDEAFYLYGNDYAMVLRQLRTALPWIDQLDDTRKLVLIDMCFNLGIDKLERFQNTLRSIREKQYELAAQHMLDSQPWAAQVGSRAVTLAQMMRDGRLPAFLESVS